jgi:hypothetical protein
MKAPQRRKLFEDVFSRDGGRCVYCGVETRRLRKGVSRAPISRPSTTWFPDPRADL